ncbi:hypothetical protein [Streptomyces sp. NPDC053431]|uniref:hypothetical protein n=1 Tax=Streptomyces sp. NPDC053431 TaxID=3365703 RepID=UPI0037CD1E53
MLNAAEIDILPGVRGDLAEPYKGASGTELADVLLPLVDRGWIDVCRVVPWTAPDGSTGFQPGSPLAREELPSLLADDGNWRYPDDGDWIGCLTLTLTAEGREIPW